MYRGGGMGSVVAGMIAIAIGIGVIVVSYQLAQPGGIYFVPIGLIASGFLAIFRGLAMPSATRRKRRTHARPARSTMNSHTALPQHVPPGYCWQCGRKVREGNAICYSCGAAQIHMAAPRKPADSDMLPPV